MRKLNAGETLGEKLKKVRLHEKVSLEDLSDKTGIQTKYLSALEEGQYDTLPADVYTRGFLRSYARFFHLPEKDVVKYFERERELFAGMRGIKKEPSIAPSQVHETFVLTPRMIKIGIIAFVVVLVLAYIGYETSKLMAPPRLEVTEPAFDTTVLTNTLVVAGKTDPETTLLMNGELIKVERDGAFRETVSLQEGLNTITVTARSKLGKEASTQRKVILRVPGGLPTNTSVQ